ncbi:MAG: hypothetical protein ACYC7E_23245 [Armatimonadota bacterium]
MRTLTRKTWTRLFWLLLLVLLAGWGAWRWVTRLETMRLERTIPVERNSAVWVHEDAEEGPYLALFGKGGGLYLHKEYQNPEWAKKGNGPATISLMDWENRARWRVSARLSGTVREEGLVMGHDAGRSILSLSPEGRTFAIARVRGLVVRVGSWHDGRPLGQAAVTLPGTAITQTRWYRLQATDSGRVWLYDSGNNALSASSYGLWAIDGSRVSSGSYRASFTAPNRGAPCQLSPGGTRLLCEDAGAALDYVDLAVADGRVRATRRYTLTPKAFEGWSWLDDERAWTYDRVIGPAGVLATVPDIGDPVYPQQGRPWHVPAGIAVDFLTAPDGRTALVVGREPYLPAPLEWLIGLLPPHMLNRLAPSRLEVYTAPGRLRAVQTLPDDHLSTVFAALAPDGRQVALMTKEDGRYVVKLYGWGK